MRGDRVAVATTKYGGAPHYRFTAEIVEVRADLLAAYAPAGTVCDSYRGSFPFHAHELYVNWLSRDWNLNVQWEPDWVPHCHYVNVALPSRWDDGTLRYVDLDLDVIQRPDGTVVLDDADEFAENRVRYGYPPGLVARAEAAAGEVLSLARAGAPPFDGGLYAWRPGDPLRTRW